MRKKNFKGRCEKRVIAKCNEVCRTYDAIQYAYADILQANDEVKEIRCNVPLDGRDIDQYTSDFVCVKLDNDLMVRERSGSPFTPPILVTFVHILCLIIEKLAKFTGI